MKTDVRGKRETEELSEGAEEMQRTAEVSLNELDPVRAECHAMVETGAHLDESGRFAFVPMVRRAVVNVRRQQALKARMAALTHRDG